MAYVVVQSQVEEHDHAAQAAVGPVISTKFAT